MSLSRRNLLRALLRPIKAGSERAQATLRRQQEVSRAAGSGNVVAMIQGRYCLAYQGSYCTICYENCPVPGAIQLDDGLARVVLETCTGCGICHDVCPAPENAILITPRPAGRHGPAGTDAEAADAA